MQKKKNDDWGWFELDSLPSSLHSGVAYAVNNLL